MARLVAACLLLGALLCCAASASRSAPWERFERLGGDAETIKWLQQSLRERASLAKEGGDEKMEKAIIATKFEVPPSMQNDFIGAWLEVQEATGKEEGTQNYDLKKTLNDDIYFWTYGEWESMDKYLDHFNSDYVMKFLDFLDDKDIMWHMYPLKNITDKAAMKKQEMGYIGKKGDQPMAHFVFEYHVPPSKATGFTDAWTKCAQETWQEETNQAFALRKVASMNHNFVAYGSWDSYEAFLEHFDSEHSREFRRFMEEQDIVWFSSHLVSMGMNPEGKFRVKL